MMQDSTQLIDSGFSDASRITSKAFFIKGRKTVVVDTSRPCNAENILGALERNGIRRENVSLILLTHAHNDHYGSARALKDVLHVPIAIGKADAPYMAAGGNAFPLPNSAIGRIVGRALEGLVKNNTAIAIKPDIILDGAMDLSEFGVDAEAFPTPGHTNGSISVAVRSGDCAIGDLLMGIPPRNTPKFPILADKGVVGASLKKVLEHDPVWLCPAHGNRIEAAEARKRFAKNIT
ncbi:MAG TPA: MBL fold metallo-hydrolase [Methanocella sp.]|nr:MBL fold metallo-hydrolase [Methanocella sp.]